MFAFHYFEDGLGWVRIWDETQEWDEPLSDFEIAIDLTKGTTVYRQGSGKGVEYTFKEQEFDAA